MSLNPRKGPAGRKITLTAPTGGVTSGAIVIVQDAATGEVGFCAEALTTAAAGESYAAEYGHASYIPKNTGTGESFVAGDPVYRDDATGTDGNATADAGSGAHELIGRALEAAGTAATGVWVQFQSH